MRSLSIFMTHLKEGVKNTLSNGSSSLECVNCIENISDKIIAKKSPNFGGGLNELVLEAFRVR